MKYRMRKRITAASLTAIMLLAAGGCSTESEEAPVVIEPMEIEEVYAYSPDFIGGTDVMPITGFYGPYYLGHSYQGVNVPNYISDDIFSKLSECGINMIKQSNVDAKTDPEAQIKILELAEKYGIAVYVRHGDVYGRHLDEDFSLEEIGEAINEFANYPAFAGLDIVDEPGTDYWWSTLSQGHIADYAERAELLREFGISYGVNAIGGNASLGDTYDAYLTDFCEILQPNYLCHTNYTYSAIPDVISDSEKHSQMQETLWLLDKTRSYANQYQIPLWRHIQAGGQFSDEGTGFDSEPYFPTEGQFLWDVNVTLVYGAKGISYFTLIQPLHFSYAKTEAYDSQRNGLIGVWGNRTQYWYYAQKQTSR